MEDGPFDAEQFRSKLMEYSDAELRKLGTSVSPAASRSLDAIMKQINSSKYALCRQEWRRRHPRASS
jgi:hypothetical protein